MDTIFPNNRPRPSGSSKEPIDPKSAREDSGNLNKAALGTSIEETRESKHQEPPTIEATKTDKTDSYAGNPALPEKAATPKNYEQSKPGQPETESAHFDSSDPFGAELGKEAQVWRVYVQEADRHDNELVDGWNKSLDVILGRSIQPLQARNLKGPQLTNSSRGNGILVFAALFSAVSTAFIMESSKKLQPDPAEVATETLPAISQTLLAIASHTGVDPLPNMPEGNTESGFVPSRTSVVVNVLWYLSLSLSIATSLLAMLAKEWCRAFLANRTGHPYSQSQRRQAKWMMIERWKMQELLIVLPSLIHMSLLLFAVGLCINVWELNNTVAIPVICITGAALLFYIGSSIMAGFVECFPYMTIVSIILRSKQAQYFGMVFYSAFGFIFFCLLSAVILLLPLVILLLLLVLLVVSYFLIRLVEYLVVFIRYCQRLGHSHPLSLHLGRRHHSVSEMLRTIFFAIFYRIGNSIYATTLPRNPVQPNIQIDPGAPYESTHNYETSSAAVAWLIETCETPSSVAIGLQAIAGASSRLPREPLERCETARKILRILVSHHSRGRSSLETRRYVRALRFLGRSDMSNLDNNNTEDLEIMIRNLQAANENYVSNLVTIGNFEPDEHALSALHVGKITPIYILRMVKENGQLDSVLLQQINNTIESLYPIFKESAHQSLAPCRIIEEGLSGCDHLATRQLARVNHTVSLLRDNSFTGSKELLDILWIAATEILSKPGSYGLPNGKRQHLSVFHSNDHQQFYQHFETAGRSERYLETVYHVYQISPTEEPPLLIHMSIVEHLCTKGSGSEHAELIMSGFAFPGLSEELLTILERRDDLGQMVFHPRHFICGRSSYRNVPTEFAATQLWLLFALLGNIPSSSYDDLQRKLWNWLQPKLKKYYPKKEPQEIRQEVEEAILSSYVAGLCNDSAAYIHRVVECIFGVNDFSNGPNSNYEEKARVSKKLDLEGVPDTLRGFRSFTPAGAWVSGTVSEPVAQLEVGIPPSSSLAGDFHIEMGNLNLPQT